MNQRIRELVAKNMVEELQNRGVYQFYDFELEMFAELIVQECAKFLRDLPDHGTHNYYKYASLKLQKHFGVEDE